MWPGDARGLSRSGPSRQHHDGRRVRELRQGVYRRLRIRREEDGLHPVRGQVSDPGGRRAAERINAAQTAPAEVVDHKVMPATLDKQVGAMIAQPTTAEAGEWLDPVK